MLPDRSILVGQKLIKNANIFKCDILSHVTLFGIFWPSKKHSKLEHWKIEFRPLLPAFESKMSEKWRCLFWWSLEPRIWVASKVSFILRQLILPQSLSLGREMCDGSWEINPCKWSSLLASLLKNISCIANGLSLSMSRCAIYRNLQCRQPSWALKKGVSAFFSILYLVVIWTYMDLNLRPENLDYS